MTSSHTCDVTSLDWDYISDSHMFECQLKVPRFHRERNLNKHFHNIVNVKYGIGMIIMSTEMYGVLWKLTVLYDDSNKFVNMWNLVLAFSVQSNGI